jgi:hypothetical protein
MKRGVELEPPRSIRYGGSNPDDLELMTVINNFSLEDMHSGAHCAKVLEILNRNANPNTQLEFAGPTALLACADHPIECFDLQVALLLIEWGADPTATYHGYTALDMVEGSGNSDGTERLRRAIDVFCPWVAHLAEVNYFDRNAKRSNNGFHSI